MGDPKIRTDAECLWNVSEAARYLHASKSWTYKAVERGHLPAVRLGGMLRFRPEDVRRFVADKATAR